MSCFNFASAGLNLPSNSTIRKKPEFKAAELKIKKSEQQIKKFHAKSVKKLKTLKNVNLLVNKKNTKTNKSGANSANMKMLITNPDTVNIDVQKISFGNELSFYPINAIDPQCNNGNPGGRGPNQLIAYTPNYGLKTNTNEYGKEAIVEEGRVVAMSSMDSLIPLNGFVISGHGKGKEWIEKNIILGTRVDVNKTTMTISSLITPDTYVFEAQEKIKEAQEINYYYKKMRYSMLQSDFYIEKANTFLNYAKCSSH